MNGPTYFDLEQARLKKPNDEGLVDVDFTDDPITEEELEEYWDTYHEQEELRMKYTSSMEVYFPDMAMDDFSPANHWG